MNNIKKVFPYLRYVLYGLRPFLFPMYLVLMIYYALIDMWDGLSINIGMIGSQAFYGELNLIILYVVTRVAWVISWNGTINKKIIIPQRKHAKIPWSYSVVTCISLVMLANFDLFESFPASEKQIIFIALVGTSLLSVVQYIGEFKRLNQPS
ncbi:hypothetical protein ACFYU8_17690 [Brevibacillus sp. NPDC003359]|uniref:hypothetical protein n=1 Tax=unclassified Brevibacillus TaxID=2684853 RepID=UPI0036902CC6